jgi:HNH endonuclease
VIFNKIFHDRVTMDLRFPSVRKICLFCKSEDKNCFTSEEHVFPESLGNKTVILPPGVVCDVCNQYFSKLENQFIHSYPMLFERFLSPVPTTTARV